MKVIQQKNSINTKGIKNMKRHASKMYSVFIASVLSVTLLPTSAFAEITDDSAPNFELDKDNEQGEFSENYWHEYDDKPENKEQSEYGQATEEIIENVENNIQIEYAEENTSEHEKNDYELFDTYTENSVITINNTSELIDAIKNQKDGQTWIIASGEYDVTEVFNGQSGSSFIIEKDNITIEAYDKNNKPVIYGFSSAASGTANGINGQNTITVSGNNCIIKDLKIMPLAGFGSNSNQYQKALEVTGNDSFTLMGCEYM